MLRDLHVGNLAVLASATVEPGPGLNVLTGETGAGKSIVVDSLALLGGARADTDLVRRGADLLTVSGVFEPAGDGWRAVLADAGLEGDGDELLIRREISREARNRVFLDDRPVTLGLLAQVAPWLLRIHTQREEMGLVSPELQREWLDRSGGDEAEELLAAVSAAWERWRGLAERLERAAGDERARLERIDLLRFQADEIDAARLAPGEDEELRAERDVLRNREAITRSLAGSWQALYDDEAAVVDRLAAVRHLLEEIEAWESQAGGWLEELGELRIRAQEVATAIRDRLDEVESDTARLDSVEERLAAIERLARKYGGGASEILAQRERIGAELEELEGDAERRDELAGEVEAALAQYREAALELSAARRRWGGELAERVHGELADLAMGRARFSVRLEPRRREDGALEIDGQRVAPGEEGIDRVVFELAANPGEASGPIARVASGGELSRVYLALRLAVGGEGAGLAPTMVFDEVDAGLGGAEAAALGRKLARLARGGQILAVTHMPQVASCADRHFKVSKRVRGERTEVEVRRLDDDGRVEEIARMLAGEKVTDLSRSHAREMLDSAAAERGSGA